MISAEKARDLHFKGSGYPKIACLTLNMSSSLPWSLRLIVSRCSPTKSIYITIAATRWLHAAYHAPVMINLSTLSKRLHVGYTPIVRRGLNWMWFSGTKCLIVASLLVFYAYWIWLNYDSQQQATSLLHVAYTSITRTGLGSWVKNTWLH